MFRSWVFSLFPSKHTHTRTHSCYGIYICTSAIAIMNGPIRLGSSLVILWRMLNVNNTWNRLLPVYHISNDSENYFNFRLQSICRCGVWPEKQWAIFIYDGGECKNKWEIHSFDLFSPVRSLSLLRQRWQSWSVCSFYLLWCLEWASYRTTHQNDEVFVIDKNHNKRT